MFVPNTGDYGIEVKGESHYQPALRDVGAGLDQELDPTKLRVRAEGLAVWLRRAPENPHDPNAVEVRLADGRIAGFLSRETAVGYAPVIDSLGAVQIWCSACIFARRETTSSDWNCGVWLALPPAEDLLGELLPFG